MKNPYKKFQNSSIQGSKVMLCINKHDERTDWRMDGRTNNPEAICPSNFFEVGGIKMHPPFAVCPYVNTIFHMLNLTCYTFLPLALP